MYLYAFGNYRGCIQTDCKNKSHMYAQARTRRRKERVDTNQHVTYLPQFVCAARVTAFLVQSARYITVCSGRNLYRTLALQQSFGILSVQLR